MALQALSSASGRLLAKSGAPDKTFNAYEGLRASKGPQTSQLVPATSFVESTSGSTRQAASGVTRCVATPIRPPTAAPAKRSKVEIIKENSNFLRYPLLDELKSEAPNVNEASVQLIKFHGSYQQDNRDDRTFGSGKAYQFMMRTRQPGGKVSTQLYLTMDKLADEFGNGTLRLTDRQTFQLHGVLKKDLKHVFATVIRNMGSTLGACGDLNRNVLAPPAPFMDRPEYVYAQEYADKIADLLAPQAGAYYDVWLDGERVMSSEREDPDVTAARNDNSHGTNFEGSPEPIYGTQFLPRKFKIAFAVPGDNSCDILTNDVGIVVLCNDKGELQGFDLYVGGGMGRTHRNESTFPRLAEPLGYVPKEDILYAVKAILATQRDYGRRDDRRMSRMKYLIHDWGIDKFRSVVEQYYGKKFEPFKELPEWKLDHYLGWHDQGDGKCFFGVHVQNGRVKGDFKRALRMIIEQYNLPVRITANQNILLCDVRKSWKAGINRFLNSMEIAKPNSLDPLDVTSMACPALPTCGLAIAESERTLPDLNDQIRALLNKVGLKKKTDNFTIRMTGCPNGCARPYVAELGLVGDGPSSYQVWLGGSPGQTRLAETYLERVKYNDITRVLEPLLAYWKKEREPKEAFGDFCHRKGFEDLKGYTDKYWLGVTNGGKAKVPLDKELAETLAKKARSSGVSVENIVKEAVEKYLAV